MSFILWNMSSVQTITCIVKCFVVFKFFLTNVMKMFNFKRTKLIQSLLHITLFDFFSILKDQLIIRFAWKGDFIKYKHIHVKKLIIYIWDVTMHLFVFFQLTARIANLYLIQTNVQTKRCAKLSRLDLFSFWSNLLYVPFIFVQAYYVSLKI